jgi:hypothetical protein
MVGVADALDATLGRRFFLVGVDHPLNVTDGPAQVSRYRRDRPVQHVVAHVGQCRIQHRRCDEGTPVGERRRTSLRAAAVQTVLRESAELPLRSVIVAEPAVWNVKCSTVRAWDSCRSRSASEEPWSAVAGGTNGGDARASWTPEPPVAVMIAPSARLLG